MKHQHLEILKQPGIEVSLFLMERGMLGNRDFDRKNEETLTDPTASFRAVNRRLIALFAHD